MLSWGLSELIRTIDFAIFTSLTFSAFFSPGFGPHNFSNIVHGKREWRAMKAGENYDKIDLAGAGACKHENLAKFYVSSAPIFEENPGKICRLHEILVRELIFRWQTQKILLMGKVWRTLYLKKAQVTRFFQLLLIPCHAAAPRDH